MMTISKYCTVSSLTSAVFALAIFTQGGSLVVADGQTGAEQKSAKKARMLGSIVGLRSKSNGANTTLRIQGQGTPTFTVYKLDNPLRVVVDIASTKLDETLLSRDDKAIWAINSWAVAQASAYEMGKAQGRVRVVISLSRPSSYQVRADGKDVLVEVVANVKPGATNPGILSTKENAVRSQHQNPQETEKTRAETARLRAEMVRNIRKAEAEIVAAKKTMAMAAERSAAAKKATERAAAAESDSLRQQKALRDAENSLRVRKESVAKAERAATDAAAEAASARKQNAKNYSELQRKAKAAARSLKRQQIEAENAVKLAEQERKAVQSLDKRVNQRRRGAKQQEERAQKAEASALAAQAEAENALRVANQRRADADIAFQNADTQRVAAQKELRRARHARVDAEAARDEATAARTDAEQVRTRVLATEAEVQKQLAKAVAVRKAAEVTRLRAESETLRAKETEEKAKAQFERSLVVRAKAEKAEESSAIIKAKEHENAAQKILEQARMERELADKARDEGAAALKIASRREREATEKLDLARRNRLSTKSKGAKVLARLREIDVVERPDVSRLVIELSAPATPVVRSSSPGEAILEIPMVSIDSDQERTLDTSRLKGAIRAVSSYRDPRKSNAVKIVVELNGRKKGALKKVGNIYYWDFPKTKSSQAIVRSKTRKNKTKLRSYRSQSVAGYGTASSPITQQTVAQVGKRSVRTYRGQKIDLDYKRSDIHDLMRLLAKVGGVNIIVPDDIAARVTIRLRRVPWDQALDVILASKGLGFKMEGPKLYRIATQKELDAEFEAKVARAQALANSEAPKPEIFNLNYVEAGVVQEQLTSLLSAKGSVQIDKRTNAVIINDVDANRARIVEMLTRLDTQTPQIQIEARIVEARSAFVRQFGIQWGGNLNASAAGGNATGLIFPSSIGLAGAADDGQTPVGGIAANPSNFAVNLPAAIGAGSGGGIGLSLGSVGGNLGLNLRLSALEDEGTVRIVSSPKITTSNNTEATIKSGVSIPISVVSANGVQTQFVPADLELKVTPAVSLRDCAVSMKVDVKKNEADFVNTGARGDPTLLTKEAKTTILVQDGDTSVIGGIYTRNSGVAHSKVPFLGDIPVLGWLFKTSRENDERAEVLIFITPKITNRANLPCGGE